MRLFLAIELSPGVRESIAAFQEELRPETRWVRWVRPENLHLTIRFLGEVAPARVPALAQLVREKIVGVGPFEIAFRAVGCFPNPKKARVVWVGVDPVPAELTSLQATSETAVRQAGFDPEPRPFKPHLTIARVKQPDPVLVRKVSGLSCRSFGRVRVTELVLLESRLSPKGASYHALERLPLGGIGGTGGTGQEQLV